ncbi:PiggyBac transposable element-derived protein 1 [Araneus ventricosus]|uniref:PiggyBac transposable element-derived protein 1 n=1 Tax=Araneus ventricosus TaxID=182803 RepID=A0A4Y2KJC1_ARAVE|nr:PiggyBac transposable element-derived protein 1 [Araneus ventricosus]
MALDVSSNSDDGQDFDDFSDEDPTVNPKDLESSDSDNETNLYSTQKSPNKPVDCTVYDIHKFIDVYVLSSLAPPTCVRDLWNDVYEIDLVKEAMSQRHFGKLQSSLHFNDNAKTPDHDKLYKIRVILDYLNQRFLSVPMSERLSIDEQMCATKARHHMKMYMKDKPHKFDYKDYVLCGNMGFDHKFEIYSGQKNDIKFKCDDEPDIGASGNVVIRLSREIPRNQNYKLYFDRYYSSLNFSVYLFQQGIQCVGTIQRNRITNCKFRNDQELKKEPSDFSEEFSTNFESMDISTVLYKDNSNAAFLSNFVGEMPKSEVGRFDRKKK